MPDRSPWISVGSLGEAFEAESHVLPASDALAGRTLQLCLEDATQIALYLETGDRLRMRTTGRVTPLTYRATQVRPDIFFLDHLETGLSGRPVSVSTVLDVGRGICTVLRGQLPEPKLVACPLRERMARCGNLTGIEIRYLAGALDRPFATSTPRHLPTADLVGRRVEYTYSRSERYEHLYLNPERYTWHCLAGVEAGLADTDACQHHKVAEGLFLFSWQEKIVPTLGVVLVDLQQRRSQGKIFGYRTHACGEVTNFPVGSRITRIVEPAA